MTPTVLIVEDHPLYRGALIQLLQSVVGDSGVMAASSAEAGLQLLKGWMELKLIVMDMGLPGLSGVEAIRAFLQARPEVPIIVVSASEDRQEAKAALRAGANVFLSKAVATETIAMVAREVLAGVIIKEEWITASGIQSWHAVEGVVLTPRQQETLVLLSNGYSNKEIGLRLGLTENTVKAYVSAVFRALNVVNRTQAVLAARRMGLCAQEVEPTVGGAVGSASDAP